MELLGHVGWHLFDFMRASKANILNNGIDECNLREMIMTLVVIVNVDADIVCWMALVVNFEYDVSEFLNKSRKTGFLCVKYQSVIHIDNKNGSASPL